MKVELRVHDLPECVKSVNIKEQKVFDGFRFPLVLSPEDSFKEKDAEFWNEWVEKNLKVLENLLFHYGAILFRKFPFDTTNEFDNFAKSFDYDPFLNVIGSGVRYHVVGNVYTAGETPPEYDLPLHHDMVILRDYPYILFFYCDIPAKEGGNTPIAPSNVVYRMMAERDPDFVQRLEKEGLRYTRVAPDENAGWKTYGRSWQSMFSASSREEAEKNAKADGFDFEWLDNGAMKITTEALPGIRVDKRTGRKMWFNALMAYYAISRYKGHLNKYEVTFSNGDTISDKSFEILKQVLEEFKVSFKWQHTDVIMVDNRSTLHGKESTPSPPRRILFSCFKDYQGPLETTGVDLSKILSGQNWA